MAADRDGYARVGEALLETGTTAFQPTFVTAPEEALLAALRAMPLDGIGAARARRARRGAVPVAAAAGRARRRALLAPDLGLLRRLLDAAPVSQVTLAPELPGAFELIDELVARGVTVSAGHTDATAAEAHLAFDRGVRTVTHLFNAMRPSTARDPSIAWSALARPDVIVQVIVDLHHVAPDTVLVGLARGLRALRAGHRRRAGGRDRRRRVRPRRAPVARRRRRRARARGPARRLGADDDRGRAQPALARRRARGRAAGGVGESRRGWRSGRTWAARPGAPADIVVLDDRLEIRRAGRRRRPRWRREPRRPPRPPGITASCGLRLRGRGRERQRLAVAARAGRSGSTSRSRACCRAGRARAAAARSGPSGRARRAAASSPAR